MKNPHDEFLRKIAARMVSPSKVITLRVMLDRNVIREIYLTPEEAKELEKIAKIAGRSRADLLRMNFTASPSPDSIKQTPDGVWHIKGTVIQSGASKIAVAVDSKKRIRGLKNVAHG